MKTRVYLSNLSPRWPIKRQEEVLRAAFPDYPKGLAVYRDELDGRARQAHMIASLAGRKELLRRTRRQEPDLIVMASPGVFAWGAEDLLECLTLAMARQSTIRTLEPDLTISPGAGPDVLSKVVEAFNISRRERAAPIGKPGATASGERRRAIAKAKAEALKPFWCLPAADYPTIPLLQKFGISRNTAKFYLGPRDVAQRIHQQTIKRRKPDNV